MRCTGLPLPCGKACATRQFFYRRDTRYGCVFAGELQDGIQSYRNRGLFLQGIIENVAVEREYVERIEFQGKAITERKNKQEKHSNRNPKRRLKVRVKT